ncbi:MAG: DUF433 domain-containing protein [Anaerolineae bacterium]|nr:DUF433 domain-containing protein [Anaerolineae bacterium]
MSGPRPSSLPAESVIHSDPEIHSGAPVFVGTRVPVQTLIDYLEGGYRLDEYLDDFPSVRREQAIAFLDQATRALLEKVA